MLKVRYDDIKLRVIIEGGKLDKYSFNLVWWSDIISLEKMLLEDFFAKNCNLRVGDEFTTSFWHSQWLDEGVIKFLFPSLFDLSLL